MAKEKHYEAPATASHHNKSNNKQQEAAVNSQETALNSQEAAINSQEASVNPQEAAVNSQEAAVNSQEVTLGSFMGGILEQLTRFNDNFEKLVKVLEENNGVMEQGVQKMAKSMAGGVAVSAILGNLANFAQNGAKWREMAQKGAKCTAQGAAQKKEASSSSPLSPPLKDEKERTKEKEENNPSLITPTTPEENFYVRDAQKIVRNDSEVQILHEEAVKKEMDKIEKSFQKFWDAYGYKRDRYRAWEIWKEMSWKDREAAMAGVERYKRDCECREINMAYGKNYLLYRRWEDEYDSEPDMY